MPGATDPLTEYNVIDILRERCAGSGAGVVLGIGDDAAVTQVPAGYELVTAVDALVEGTHFLPAAAPGSVGHRCLAVNLSDLAAMGATPLWATLSLSLPAPDRTWLTAFADAFASLAATHNVSLIGGDTVRGPLAASVTLLGTVAAGAAITRSSAAADDGIYVTGLPGQAAAGWRQAVGQLPPDTPAADRFRQCFEYPTPRVGFGIALAQLASAMIDVSDGVAPDLGRLLTASGVGATAEIPDLGCLQQEFGVATARELFLAGGEDYELCFTAPAEADSGIVALAERLDVPVARIGTVTAATGLRWQHNGADITGEVSGFEHFVA